MIENTRLGAAAPYGPSGINYGGISAILGTQGQAIADTTSARVGTGGEIRLATPGLEETAEAGMNLAALAIGAGVGFFAARASGQNPALGAGAGALLGWVLG